MHKVVLHVSRPFRHYSIGTPVENLPALREKLYLSFAYTEILGDHTYDHYDVEGVKRGRKRTAYN